MSKPKWTKKPMLADDKYVESPACPHCGYKAIHHEDIHITDLSHGSFTVGTRLCTCPKCKMAWQEQYEILLTGYIAKDYKGDEIPHIDDSKADLERQRDAAADEAFEYSREFKGVTVGETDGWETDGDYWNRNVYVEDDDKPEADSRRVTFQVEFKPGTAKVIDAHVNW